MFLIVEQFKLEWSVARFFCSVYVTMLLKRSCGSRIGLHDMDLRYIWLFVLFRIICLYVAGPFVLVRIWLRLFLFVVIALRSCHDAATIGIFAFALRRK